MTDQATDRFDFLVAIVFMLFSFIYVIIQDSSWMFFFSLGIIFLIKDVVNNSGR